MTKTLSNRRLGIGYAATIFLSAFLLFQVQPLIGKYILPWFGGTPSVWTTCMLFFQILLFGGYLYAHLITTRFTPRWQLYTHIALIAAALFTLPIVPNSNWKPTGAEEPISRIVILLVTSVGLPFFVVSSTGPLLQGWFARSFPGRSPYRLYALSNLGSLLALVSYPFVIEPAFPTSEQAGYWSWGFVVFALGCAWCGMRAMNATASMSDNIVSQTDAETPKSAVRNAWARQATANIELDCEPPTWGTRVMWFLLAMAASEMLLATTNQVCMDVASVPFLWVLPLTLYLLSFILCFDGEIWYTRRIYAIGVFVSMGTITKILYAGMGVDIKLQVLVLFSGLFFCAMFCHGELARLKPHPRYLTSFYLLLSAGGAAGGLFVGAVAPLIFVDFLELPIGMIGCCVLLMIIYWRDPGSPVYRGRRAWLWAFPIVGLLVLTAFLAWHTPDTRNVIADRARIIAESLGRKTIPQTRNVIIAQTRNFYGVLRVKDHDTNSAKLHWRELLHGRTLHGVQFVQGDNRRVHTTYYSHDSGVGRILAARNPLQPKRVGVVGLGVGTLASYGMPGDVYRFYEINPDVIRLAREQFYYLSDCRADVEMELGDARLSMEREEPQHFDVLVLDAFSSDAIPVHLLTVEAVEIYLKHLVDDGVLAIHISNGHFDLRPVVEAIADRFSLAVVDVQTDYVDVQTEHHERDELKRSTSKWLLLSADPSALTVGGLQDAARKRQHRRILWTDRHSNLFEVLY